MLTVVPTVQAMAILAILKANLLDGAVMKLFQNNLVVGNATHIADFTEATFTGYASQTLTLWGAPRREVDGSGETVAPEAVFASSGPAVQNIVYGYWIETAKGALILAGNFDGGPLTMNDVGDQVVIVLKVSQPNTNGESILLT